MLVFVISLVVSLAVAALFFCYVRPVNIALVDLIHELSGLAHSHGHFRLQGWLFRLADYVDFYPYDSRDLEPAPDAPVDPVVSATEDPEEAALRTPVNDTAASAAGEPDPVDPVVSATEDPGVASLAAAEKALKDAREGRLASRPGLRMAYELNEDFRRLLNDSECNFIYKIVEERKLSRAEKRELKALLNK